MAFVERTGTYSQRVLKNVSLAAPDSNRGTKCKDNHPYLISPKLGVRNINIHRAAPIAVAVVVTLQLLFTYVPLMERFFDTRPVDFVHGAEIIALGMALFMILELEKFALRKWRKKHDDHRGSPGRSEAKS